jgi:hypothetical protein
VSDLLAGSKFSDSHHTYVKGAAPLLIALKNMAEVKKIALGQIKKARPAQKRLKIRSIQGNFMVIVFRDTNAAQVFNITTTQAIPVIDFLKQYTP